MDGSLLASAAVATVVNGSRNSSRVISAKYGKKKSKMSSSRTGNTEDMAPVASVGVRTRNSSPVDSQQRGHGVEGGADSQKTPRGKEGLRTKRRDSNRHKIVIKEEGDHESTSARIPSDGMGSWCSATKVSEQSPPGQTAVDPATSRAPPAIETGQGAAADKMKEGADVHDNTSHHHDGPLHTSENHLLTATGIPQWSGVALEQHHSAMEIPEAEYRRTERFGPQLPQIGIIHPAVLPVAINTTDSEKKASTTTRPSSAVLTRSTVNAGACSARHPHARNAGNAESKMSGVERSTHDATDHVRSDKKTRKQTKSKTKWQRRVDRSSSTRHAVGQTQCNRSSAPHTSDTTLPEAEVTPAGTAPANGRPDIDSNTSGSLKHPDNSTLPAVSPLPHASMTTEGLSLDEEQDASNQIFRESTQEMKSKEASSNEHGGTTVCSTVQPAAMRQSPTLSLVKGDADAANANMGNKIEVIPHYRQQQQQQQQPAAKAPVRQRPVLRADAKPFEWSKSTDATISPVSSKPCKDCNIVSATESTAPGGCVSAPPLAAAVQQDTIILPERPTGSNAPTFTTDSKLLPPPPSVSPPTRVPLADDPTPQAAPLPSSENWYSSASEEVIPCGTPGNIVVTNKVNSDEESSPSSMGNADKKGGVSMTGYRDGKQRSDRSTRHTNERLLELSQRPKQPESKQRMCNNKKLQQQTQKAQHDQHEDGHRNKQQLQHEPEQPQEQQKQQQQKQQQRPEGKGARISEGATSDSRTTTKQQTPAGHHVLTQHTGVTAPYIHREQPGESPTSPSPTNSISTDQAPPARSRIALEKAKIEGSPVAGGSSHSHIGDGTSCSSAESMVHETVQVTEEILAQWVGDSGGTDGGECGKMLRDVKQSSGARAVDVRVVGKGRSDGSKNKGGRTQR